MSTTIHSYQKLISSRRALIIGGISLLSTALAAISYWKMTAQTIAPPGLLILEFLWRVFVG